MKNEKFLETVESWWREVKVLGSKLYCFVTKIKHIKRKLLQWNKEHFGDIFASKKTIEEELALLNDKIIRDDMDQDSYLKEKELLLKYEDICPRKKISGDKNPELPGWQRGPEY